MTEISYTLKEPKQITIEIRNAKVRCNQYQEALKLSKISVYADETNFLLNKNLFSFILGMCNSSNKK